MEKPKHDVVLLGGPPALAGSAHHMYSQLRDYPSLGGFKGMLYYHLAGEQYRYYFSFRENGIDYYLHESEVSFA